MIITIRIIVASGISWWFTDQDLVFSLPWAWDSIPSWGTKIPQAARCGQKKKKKDNSLDLEAVAFPHYALRMQRK